MLVYTTYSVAALLIIFHSQAAKAPNRTAVIPDHPCSLPGCCEQHALLLYTTYMSVVSYLRLTGC
jgi:hypothetical protein